MEHMIWAAVIAASLIAGSIQSITGFGAAMFLMMFLSPLLDLVTAPALSSAISVGLTVMLAWRFRKEIDLRLTLFPAAIYLSASISIISVIHYMDLELLSLAFGVFLIVLSVYFLAFSSRAHMQANWKSALVCALVSGICSGLFGIGGPLMALYFLAATDSKEAYVGNLQFLFSITSVSNLITRVVRGIYTWELLPLTILGFVSINIGKRIGLKALQKLDTASVKKIVYAFIGVSGVINVAEYFLK